MSDTDKNPLPVGSRWREKATDEVVVVVAPGPDSPWLRYESGHPFTNLWHCCVEDFFVWGRFTRLT